MERRLAAVLAADIVGYSRLMERDEIRVVELINQLQRILLEPIIARHGGRIFKTMGDGFLVEFTSVVNAVTCAHEWQRSAAAAQADGDPDFAIQFRIGISMGEVVVQGDDLLGTSINIAARLEALATPGSVCVTAEVHAQSGGRVAFGFEDLGERELKNISGRHRVYSLEIAKEDPGFRDAPMDQTADEPPQVTGTEAQHPTPDGTVDSPNDVPGLAILPFSDMATDTPNTLLAEGFSEEIVATLSRTRWLFLVASGSSNVFRDQGTDIRAVASDLGVRYVLQGRFMATTERVRVTAALIDGTTGASLRSFKIDKTFDDPFQVIDDIAIGVVGELLPEISQRERARIRRKRQGSLTAFELYLQAIDALRKTSREACREAAGLLDQALTLQPDLAIAHARRATCAIQEGYSRWGDRPIEAIAAEAMEHASRALEIDPDEALACDALASAYQLVKNFAEAEYWARRAIELNPTCVAAYGTLITVLAMQGDSEDALAFHEQLQRISPRDPEISSALMGACMAHFFARNMQQAADAARRHAVLRPNWYGNRIFLAASFGHLGDTTQAARAVEKILELEPHMTRRAHRERTVLQRPEDVELLMDGLRLAGLPE